MKKGMTVTYEVDGSLYVNVTNRCTNNCSFCIRNNGDGAYGSDSLWLLREPTAEEILDSIFSRDLSLYRELVFCGYGEPAMRLEVCREVALRVKEKYQSIRVRINTNGQSDLIYSRDTGEMYRGAFDTVSVSLNSPTSEGYFKMCRPVYGKDALSAILGFVKNVKNCVQNVVLSVVREYLSEEELSLCYEIADKLGVPLKVRTYIGAEN